MFCCIGLLAGFSVGAALGGSWVFIAPAVGFGLGLIGDVTMIKFGLHGIHRNPGKQSHDREHGIHNEEPTEV